MTATIKSTTVSGASIVRVVVPGNKNRDDQLIRFVARAKKVTVTSKGLPRLVIKTAGDAFEAFYRPNPKNRAKRVTVEAKTAEAAFQKIVRQAWTH